MPVISRLGRIYFQEKNYLESERFLLRALEIQERQLGAEHPDLEENYLILHSVYQALARPENDERILRHLLALLCNQLGENHPRVGKTLLELAHVYSFLGALEEAEPVYERALGILRPVLKGPDAQVQAAEEELARIKAGREKVKPESGFERLLRWFGVD